jgi:hypothetical protein
MKKKEKLKKIVSLNINEGDDILRLEKLTLDIEVITNRWLSVFKMGNARGLCLWNNEMY